MSSSFDELEEDEQNELEAKERPTSTMFSTSSQHHLHRTLPHEHTTELSIALQPSSGKTNSGSFLPTLTRKTTSRLCHWISSNWPDRGTAFSTIDVRECLPPIYHNTKNIMKTIKV